MHVAGQLAAGGEAFAALGAYEQFHPRVGVHVADKVALPGEAFAALDAYERFGPRVSVHVPGQVVALGDTITAPTRPWRLCGQSVFERGGIT